MVTTIKVDCEYCKAKGDITLESLGYQDGVSIYCFACGVELKEGVSE